MTDAATAADVVVTLVALAAGYLVGSIPLAPPATRTAGPGWTFLALTAGLAKGVIPVAAGVVTVSWAIGWVAGIGAVLGAAWPAFGRRTTAPDRSAPIDPGADRVASIGATFVGAAFTLAPPAGGLAAVIALVVHASGRLLGRDTGRGAVAVAVVVYPLLFAVIQPDPTRLAALLAMYLVAAVVLLVRRR